MAFLIFCHEGIQADLIPAHGNPSRSLGMPGDPQASPGIPSPQGSLGSMGVREGEQAVAAGSLHETS